MRKHFLLVAAMVAGSVLWLSPAHADLISTYNIDGGGTTNGCTAASGSACSYSVTASGVTITLDATSSNSPGGAGACPGDACITDATTSITNGGTSNATIVLTVGDINFTTPTGPADLFSAIGGSVFSAGTSNALSYVSCVDQANGQNTCPATFDAPALTPPITAKGSFNATNTTPIANLTAPFSETELLTITLTPGSSFNFSSSTTVTPVPEPASLILFGAGLIGLGLFFGYRRKRA